MLRVCCLRKTSEVEVIPAAVSAALVALVFTNDLHNWVFTLGAGKDYGYGAGYYLVMATCVVMVTIAVVVMLVKSRQSPRKKGFLYPIVLCALLLAYAMGYGTPHTSCCPIEKAAHAGRLLAVKNSCSVSISVSLPIF